MMKIGTIALHLSKMLRATLHGASAKDIREATGLNKNTITNYIRALHNEGVIHRIGFGRDSRGTMRRHMPIWQLGEGADVPWTLPDRNTRRRQKYWEARLKVLSTRDKVPAAPKRKVRQAPVPYDRRRVENRELPDHGVSKSAKRIVERVAKSSELAAVMMNLGK